MRKARHLKAHKSLRKHIDSNFLQSWLFYSLVFVAVLFVLFLMINNENYGEQDIINNLESEGIIDGNQVNENALSDFDYSSFKQRKGLNDEFYIVFEDLEGQPVEVNGKTCYGSPEAKMLDKRCS